MTDTKPISEVVEELGRLEKNATPGPWSTERPKGQRVGGFQTGLIVAGTGPGMGIYADPPGGSYPSNDRHLIAAMRNALPSLLAEITRGREEIERAEKLRRALWIARRFMEEDLVSCTTHLGYTPRHEAIKHVDETLKSTKRPALSVPPAEEGDSAAGAAPIASTAEVPAALSVALPNGLTIRIDGHSFKLVYKEDLIRLAGPIKGRVPEERRAAQLIREAWNKLPHYPFGNEQDAGGVAGPLRSASARSEHEHQRGDNDA